MLKKLYEIGCFDYKKFILDYSKKLSLTSSESIVLIKILDQYISDKTFSSEQLSARLSLSKTKMDKALVNLLERGFYEIYIHHDNGIGQEYISLDGFFEKVKAILDNKAIVSIQDEIASINQYLTKELNRILTARELEILTCLVKDDGYRLENFRRACDIIKQKNINLNITTIAQHLVQKEETQEKPSSNLARELMSQMK